MSVLAVAITIFALLVGGALLYGVWKLLRKLED
jgi:hypothetical protein